jgi:endonuclease YncB( thermonuclease family)
MGNVRKHGVPGLVAVILLAAGPAAGQTVIDGDSLRVGAKQYRLNGIDAPEADQVCPDGWPAGFEARRYLEQLVDGKEIRCIRLYGERHGEPFAVCRADGVDLGSAMVVAGQAFAFVPYSAQYISQEAVAASMERGVHAHHCLPPWRWRALLVH